jgi:hypothetical protein
MASTAQREAYFRHILFGNPWVGAAFVTRKRELVYAAS